MKAGNGQVGKLFTPCFPLPSPAPTDRRLFEERRGAQRRRWGYVEGIRSYLMSSSRSASLCCRV